MNTVMGVDVGGTKILIGIVRPDGTITHERRIRPSAVRRMPRLPP